ncbi:integrase catalytic domain-containing protein [Trichonephila clavipes]|nr:integrase catalytic domain-containing protein [Trichonephila clavipes]
MIAPTTKNEQDQATRMPDKEVINNGKTRKGEERVRKSLCPWRSWVTDPEVYSKFKPEVKVEKMNVVGVDLAGPLYVKRSNKVWIVLYTCAIYRALHLELVSSLSTDAFLLSFRRFVARRGRPRIIYSNNGTNFRGAYNELIDIDWKKVSRYAEIQRITWKFIPPTAAWWGGFWERLVRTVNKRLRRTLGKAIFTYEELLTILCECEKFVNSRPLTYLSEDMQDLTPITPARFLFEIPTVDTKDLDVRDANHFRKRLRFRAKEIEELKRRFRNEYLGQLIQRQKQHPQSSNIQVGDIVLIGNDWKKRLQWPLARVIKLIPGKDGLVRTVKLKTQSCTLIRPIQSVFPLEVRGNDITNPPLQKVQQADSSVNCPNPDTLKATAQPQVTRCGRPLKKPDKLNLLTLTLQPDSTDFSALLERLRKRTTLNFS